MNLIDVRKEMNEFFKKNEGYCPITKVYCEIYGKPMYLKEIEVRYLQVKCLDWVKQGRFEEFCENHKVWSNRSKRRSKYQMTFRKDGVFIEEFENGFYSANAHLAFRLL